MCSFERALQINHVIYLSCTWKYPQHPSLAATVSGLALICLESMIFHVSSPLTKGNSKIELCGEASCGFYKIEKKEMLLFYGGKMYMT